MLSGVGELAQQNLRKLETHSTRPECMDFMSFLAVMSNGLARAGNRTLGVWFAEESCIVKMMKYELESGSNGSTVLNCPRCRSLTRV